MPATEQTWRSQSLLHRIFAVAALALLGATMWMFYADHNREWKRYQDTARDMDLAYNAWMQLQHQTHEALQAHETLALELAIARTASVSEAQLNAFRAEAEARASVDPTSKNLYESLGIEKLNQDVISASAALGEKPTEADLNAILRAEKARKAVIDALQEIVDRAVSVEDLFQTYCRALDIQADKELFTPESRPLKIVDGGKPVNELFA